MILKFKQKRKGPRITKRVLQKIKVGALTLPNNFKAYHNATVIKSV